MSDAERQQQVAQALEAITPELHADVLVVGGGLVGIAAAIAACQQGRQVVLTEQTDWVGAAHRPSAAEFWRPSHRKGR